MLVEEEDTWRLLVRSCTGLGIGDVEASVCGGEVDYEIIGISL